MVDFSKLNNAGSSKSAGSLIETFARLDRQVSHVELRPSQIEIFKQIDNSIANRDLVVKLNTGGGKTTTGLIYLKHMMDKYREPAVFLVPTTQLAEQVVDEGAKIGLDVHVWAAKESYPPEGCVQCAAVMVCTYDKFFNGKSTFARKDVRLVPCALVLDDVHSGIETIKKNFSANLVLDASRELIDLLREPLKQAEPANWTRLELGDEGAILEVPHWIISENIDAIRGVLAKYSGDGDLLFSWSYLSRSLEMCRIVIGLQGAAITLDPPFSDYLEHYVKVRHRLFMSASLHDGAPLIRELGCDEVSAANPIQVSGETAVGERMVLVPSLIDPAFSRDSLLRLARHFSQLTNVVVLVSSDAQSEYWVSGGAVKAEKVSFSAVVAKLRAESRGNFVVFVNRYDGIDLPDAACRILIIDGLPSGEGIVDRLDNSNSGGLLGMRGKLANKIEQGLGRAVRSSSDYCAVILAGQDLANFVSRRVVLESFSSGTVKQIEIGREVSKAIAQEADKVTGIANALGQLLGRDQGWREYYATQMASIIAPPGIAEEAATRRNVAVAERDATIAAQARDYPGASNKLRRAANLLEKDRYSRGAIKQSAAKIMYLHDRVAAMDLQGSAYADNYNLSRPPVLPAPSQRRISDQADLLAEWFREFDDKNGALIELDALAARVSYSNDTETVEAAIYDLGRFLGAESRRPEKETGRGPDNLWMFGERAFCIEMKSEKFSKLWKSDAGQIAVSSRWVSDNFPGMAEIFDVIGSDVVEADNVGDFSDLTKVMTGEVISDMVVRLRGLIVGLITQGPLFGEDPANIQRQLGPHGILPQQIHGYLREIK
ncbi:hypothetical protein CMZ82_01350 [Lysobacteraceae bacterium NML93-0792]|nr:hypothetical protein CMZ82_01350 [Xanthomonadaceae bacterium NML93-0792]PBS16055.1 hypothetical protein CMZ81_06890 [Xanthomonadaceae bacterium NML93-0793]PBS20081.1 hypothetical protein CMZ80_03655 [Xanthomonadaceae bacterium NML93-0831]